MFYESLSTDKYKLVHWNENLIRMDLFTSFLTVPLERSHEHMGHITGWTLLFNTEHKLEIRGGIYGGVEYLDDIKYGHRIANAYNDYVNPFYIMNILSKEGIRFFMKYYSVEIDTIIAGTKQQVQFKRQQLENARVIKKQVLAEIINLKQNCI